MSFNKRLNKELNKTDFVLSEDDFHVPELDKPARKRPVWLTQALASTMVGDFRNEKDSLQGFELLQRFNEVVALRYHLDPSIAGVHTACLSCQPGDRPMYYVAVHRYQGGNGTKRGVVCSFKGPSMEAATRMVVDIWLETLRYGNEAGLKQPGPMFELAEEHRDLTGLLQKSIDNVLVRKKGK